MVFPFWETLAFHSTAVPLFFFYSRSIPFKLMPGFQHSKFDSLKADCHGCRTNPNKLRTIWLTLSSYHSYESMWLWTHFDSRIPHILGHKIPRYCPKSHFLLPSRKKVVKFILYCWIRIQDTGLTKWTAASPPPPNNISCFLTICKASLVIWFGRGRVC